MLTTASRSVDIICAGPLPTAGRSVVVRRRVPWSATTPVSKVRVFRSKPESDRPRVKIVGGTAQKTVIVEKSVVLSWAVLAPKQQTGAEDVSRVRTGPLDLPPIGSCTHNAENPFRRIVVDYRVEGGARISWELSRKFTDAAPRNYQLQVTTSGVPTASDWTSIGPVVADAPYLQDTVKRQWGKTNLLRYRVLLTTPRGTYTSETALPLGHLNKHDWLLVRELIRKEKLRHKLFGSCFGYLLKARRSGTVCSCVDSCTGLVKNSSCLDCFGTGWVGGYHQPLPCHYADMTPESSRENRDVENVGMVKPISVKGRFSGDVPVNQNDVWISGQGSDERYHIHSIQEASTWKSVPIVLFVEMRPAPMTDVIYQIDVAI